MKTTFISLLLLLCGAATAQTATDLPRTEFLISLSENSLTIKPGESKQVTVSIRRSKSYTNDKALLGYSSVLPQGLSIKYEPSEGNFETSSVTVSADRTMKTGMYQLVINATINHKTKGSILKLQVGTDPVAAK